MVVGQFDDMCAVNLHTSVWDDQGDTGVGIWSFRSRAPNGVSAMKMRDAIELQRKWGNKPCDHPNIVQEDPIGGQWSGDYVCTQCGYSAPKKDFEKKRKESN